MEDQKPEPVAELPTPKQPYEAPKAVFVPLKLEERLLSCQLEVIVGKCTVNQDS